MKPTICFVLTSPLVLNHYLLDHLSALADYYEITVCINTKSTSISDNLDTRVQVNHIDITRPIKVTQDLKTLFALLRVFKCKRFSAVHSLTPKGGLLGMLAAKLANIQLRTHTFTGQVWVTQTGFKRYLLKLADKIIASMATHLQADSYSQARFISLEGIASLDKITVFGSGSLNGVNLKKFKSNAIKRLHIRTQLSIPNNAVVFLFLGRMNYEKGIMELVYAFKQLQQEYNTTYLLLVGPDEAQILKHVQSVLANQLTNIRYVGLTSTPEQFIDASDVLCLPSYREGFGSSIIEAAAMGVPSIASRIYGITDAIIDGRTGLLVQAKDTQSLYQAMKTMLDREVRDQLGLQAQERAIREFSSERLTEAWLHYYANHLSFNNHSKRQST
ncbi:MAG: glycosyltransferase [Thiofilum sp.]|uniref:glycosyltransferase n=1 Tax=Thiofilum sp. TaxID=2212733 RepID=UPI0025E6725C|nr:glycosyltransferase [Thiofilum sp.]MBK8451897.1 glycosyltransferase [Thiofilum sp.]